MFDKVDGVVLGFINFTSFLSLMVKFGFLGYFIVIQGGLVFKCFSVATNLSPNWPSGVVG